MIIKSLITLLVLQMTLNPIAFAQGSSGKNKRINVVQDVETLGGNETLMDRAQALDPENKARIVQRRIVDLNSRLELGVGYGGVFGGDPYLNTQSFFGVLDFHFNPHWAVGLRYHDYGSSLTSEGQRMYDQYRKSVASGGTGYFVDTDAPQNSATAVLEWSPFYGKINFFDQKVVQFDIYGMIGGGQITLEREGSTPVYTAGLGLVFWFAQNFSGRIETNYEGYQDQVMQQGGGLMKRNINSNFTSLTLGILL